MPTTTTADNSATREPSFAEAFRFWVKLGFISFGGPTGQIATMHTELVEKRKWISEPRFLHALSYCMLLPGPEAQQLATYIGWLLHRTRGGIVAGSFFVIPSIFVLWALSYIYAEYGAVYWIAAMFYGLKPAVMAIVARAAIRIGQKALNNEVTCALAAMAFVAIFFFKTPFPLIVLSAAVIGFITGKIWPGKLALSNRDPHGTNECVNDEEGFSHHTRTSWGRTVKICVVCAVLWWAPVLLVRLWRGPQDTLFREGVFFSQAAMVTFGGAYAVLPYVAQKAVEQFQWLQPGQMLDGLGLAETTPGPLIMVLQFVGFMAAWNHPGDLPPLLAATIGAFITTWVTFLPSFLWIFLGAPHIEQLRHNTTLTATLSAVTAAVVGVVLNLAVWFSIHAVWPRAGAVDWFALTVSGVAFIGMLKRHWNIIPVVIGGALLGLVFKLLIRW